MEPSILYPEGIVTSDGAQETWAKAEAQKKQGDAGYPKGPPVYTKTPHDMLVSLAYGLRSDSSADLVGRFSADLTVEAGEAGWVRTQRLLPPTEFRGTEFSAVIPIDLGQVVEMITTIERETEFKPNAYELTVLPRIEVQGRVGGDSVDEAYVPPFRMLWERNRVVPDGELNRSETHVLYDDRTVPAYLSLGPAAVSVTAARALGVGLSLLGLLATGLAMASAWRRVARDEALRIKARYGRMIVEVRGLDPSYNGQRIAVASMADLARMAKMEGRQILHTRTSAREDVYFLWDGGLIYEYRPANGVGSAADHSEA